MLLWWLLLKLLVSSDDVVLVLYRVGGFLVRIGWKLYWVGVECSFIVSVIVDIWV